MRALILPLFLALTMGQANAGPLTQSLRPQARPGGSAQILVVAAPAQPAQAAPALPTAAAQTAAPQTAAPRVSLRPLSRNAALTDVPAGVVQIAAPVQRATTPSRDVKGSVCRNPALLGSRIEPIKGRLEGCGIAEPVQVTQVHGVTLRPAAVMNCEAADALAQWVREGMQPAFGGKVVQLNIADSYSCRPRNNVAGNKVSEHGAGNAIDISAFVLRNGKIMTIADSYDRQIRRAKKAACGTFSTTLGPGSDGYHEDHIHLDVGRHGGSPYCR